MVLEEENPKLAFAERLHEAIDGIESAPGRHGRAVWLAKRFPEDITPKAVGKWLKGEAFPTYERMGILAKCVGVSKSWLSTGEGDKVAWDDETWQMYKALPKAIQNNIAEVITKHHEAQETLKKAQP